MWSVETGECLQILEGHIDEIFSCAFNYEGDTVITGSKDNTCRIWKTVGEGDMGEGGGDMGGSGDGGDYDTMGGSGGR